MTLFLTKLQVEELNQEECQKRLRALNREYQLDRPIADRMEAVWPVMDDIVNTLLYLEDRIKQFQTPSVPNPDTQLLPQPEAESKPVKPGFRKGPKCHPFRIGTTVYQDIHEASRCVGVKVHSLRNYVNRNPEKYGYLN